MLATSQNQVGQSRLYSTAGTLVLFVQQTCQNIARISSISLVHLVGYSTR